MVHYEKTYIAIKGHERESSHAIIVYGAHVFVHECSEAKDIGYQFINHVCDEGGIVAAGNTVIVVYDGLARVGG
jgi:hypothetical protein